MSLQFSDTSTKNGLIQVCEDEVFGNYGDISSNTNRLYQFTRLINEALNTVTSWILQSDGRWQWDDNNNTDLPIATANLVADQQDYAFAVTHLKILGVEVQRANGEWVTLDPIDQADLYDSNVTDFLSEAGMPQYYDKIGSSLFLYPKPSSTEVTLSSGLKVRFQRPPSYFVYTDTTKVPGFNSLYHVLVALEASKNYAVSKSLKNAKSLKDRVEEMKEELITSYAMRNKDERITISSRGSKESFK